MRWRWPADRIGAGLADAGVVAAGQPQDHVVRAGGLRGRQHRGAVRRAGSCGRCSRRRCRRTARPPATGSRCGGRGAPGPTGRSAAPSSRTMPRAAGQTPTRARASEVLPEPLGPIDAERLAGRQREMDIGEDRRVRRRAPRRRRARPRGRGSGGGSVVAAVGAGVRASVADSRRDAVARRTKARQLAIAASIGASARPIMIEAAIIAPAVSSLPDDEIGAEPEHRRLQQQPQHLGEAAIGVDDVATRGQRGEIAVRCDLASARRGRPPCPSRPRSRRCGGRPRPSRAAAPPSRDHACAGRGLAPRRQHASRRSGAPRPRATAAPSQGWIRKQIARNTGIHGRSTIAIGPGRSGRRGSGRGRAPAGAPRRRCRAAMRQPDHRVVHGRAEAASSSAAARTTMRERMTSSTPWNA